jgi:transketolase
MPREPMRVAACQAVIELFHEDPRVAVVLAEISTDLFAPAFAHDPRRAVDVGIMEQTMVGVAAGFALEGFLPVVHTIAPFLTERALEQVKLDFGYQRLEGLFVTTGASYDYAASGMTHHSPGDVSAMATVPGMEVLVPGHRDEARALVRATYANGHPTYVRTSAAENERAFELAPGGLTIVRRGSDLTVIAVGPMLDRTLAALDGIDATILYATTVVPLDAEKLAAEAGSDVVVVEPFYEGTLAAQVTAALSYQATRIHSIGVPRIVISSYGTIADHDRELRLDVHGLRERLRRLAQGRERIAAAGALR